MLQSPWIQASWRPTCTSTFASHDRSLEYSFNALARSSCKITHLVSEEHRKLQMHRNTGDSGEQARCAQGSGEVAPDASQGSASVQLCLLLRSLLQGQSMASPADVAAFAHGFESRQPHNGSQGNSNVARAGTGPCFVQRLHEKGFLEYHLSYAMCCAEHSSFARTV